MVRHPSSEVRKLQRRLNRFTKVYRLHKATLIVDGVFGPATQKRNRECQFWLGYPRKEIDGTKINRKLLWRLRHPRTTHRRTAREPWWISAAGVARGKSRRIKHRAAWKRNHQQAKKHGVGSFDGVPVANWLIPYLKWARAHGWRGRLVSGWRDPIYSEHLCIVMCGRPSCPGRCAGRSSHHSGSDLPNGAVDVSDYVTFGKLIRDCPLRPVIFNNLPIDPVHFSAQGN